MAATEGARSLAALTAAALCLPGLQAAATERASAPGLTVQSAFYDESGARMEAEVHHTELVLPFNEHFEFSFSLDRDTYSGATPAYSLPATLADQPKYKQRADGSPAAESTPADVVSAASQGVTAGGLTILGGLNAYKGFVDARAKAEAAFIAGNPRPASPPPVPTLPGPVTLDFDAMAFAAIFGQANVTGVAGGACPGNGAATCHVEDGLAVGIVADASNPVAHLHRAGPIANRQLAYHADSSGVFVRALDGSAFNLQSMKFGAAISASNPDAGGNNVWEILGFNSATLPKLGTGNGRDYPQRVAAFTVANGFDGTLKPTGFQNIKSFWIHYRGYPRTPVDGKEFELRLDDITLGAVKPVTGPTPAQRAWAQRLEREVSIEQFAAVLNQAAPTGTRTVQRLQEQPRESREQPVLALRYFGEHGSVGLSAGKSDEPDFNSWFGALELTRDTFGKQGEVGLRYAWTVNDIRRTDAGAAGHAGHGGHSHGDNAALYPALDEHSSYHSLSFSFDRLLGPLSAVALDASFTRQAGYLSNPYKLVYVRGEITPAEYYGLWQAGDDAVDWKAITPLEVVGIELFREQRPDERHLGSVSLGFRQHLPALAASLHLDYRYYADDWGIDAHTTTVSWYQSLPHEWTLTPFIRYYTQGPADFFAPWFPAPRADGHYSSDYRLSGFGALSGGVTVGKSLGERLRVQAGVEYYTHQAGLRPAQDGLGDYADYDSLLAHASLSVDLSAGGMAATHDQHRGHAMPMAPAGVMFAHSLARAGDVAVGYRYMDQRQGGALEHDGNALSPAALPKGTCLSPRCTAYPSDMGMQMHMLELMYAATDRFTLMLMPQLTSSQMQLNDVADGSPLVEHGSDGVGDTLLGATYRLGTSARQQWLIGLGLSAPTGEDAATQLGTDSSLPLDYGMQRGSGTWDARPAVTWMAQLEQWRLGAQINGTVRLEDRNDHGYALGDGWQASAWVGRALTDALQLTVRGIHTAQDSVRGGWNIPHETTATVDNPANQGGDFMDIGVGLTLAFPGGALAGHHAAIEWVQPVSTDFNGVQLGREGALNASWTFQF